METKEHSYQNHPVKYVVTILGQDVSTNLKSLEGIEASLDYPRINEYRINEAVFTLSDPENDFNPQKLPTDPMDLSTGNFYRRNGQMESPPISESGYRSPVTIEAGFVVNGMDHLETIYSGIIYNVHKDAKTGDVRIVCADQTQRLTDEPVTNFGIEKKMIVEPTGGNLHGNYPFYLGLTEPSLESIEGTGLIRKQSLRTEGHLDENNFQELPSGIQTEGGPLPSNPTLTFKSPYRSRTIESVIGKLLDDRRYNITDRDIKLPIVGNPLNLNVPERFFSNLGRPGYETSFPNEMTPVDFGQWQWPGTVTDMIANESTNELYLLISPTGSAISAPATNNPKPRIIKWDLQTDNREIIAFVSENTAQRGILEESWRFVANNDFTTFYVLGTKPVYQNATRVRDSGITTRPGFEFGSYDSSEYNASANSKVLIHRLVRSGTEPNYTWTRITYINTTVSGSLYPQLAMHYHLGFAGTDSTSQNRFPNRQGSLPDSRRNLYLASNGTDLYYPYANRRVFGVAKATGMNTATSVISANRDDDGFNLAGFDFWIEEGTPDQVYLAYTNISSSSSRFKIIRKDLS